ncbi:MAG TPA: ferritin-like domain-containing protein [Chryseolinea sp.]|nr:ferritin-like domain-containing protein [Chryseolinea sp.]
MKAKTEKSTPSASHGKKSVKSSKESLEDIFEDLLKDIYWAEKHLTKALPKMAKAAFSDELREAFETHLEQTHRHIGRLEECFELLEKKAVAKKCEAMEGLIKEGEESIEDHDAGHARDAGLIASAQKVEHYEISAYGTLRTMATVLGKAQCAQLLEETKDEEAETDAKLTELAQRINQQAAEFVGEEA